MTRFRGVLTASCALVAVTAAAQEPALIAPSPFEGYVEFMTNYVGRGLAQSVGRPSVQAEWAYYSSNGLYFNLDGTSINWIDQLYPGDSVSVELDGILGYRRRFGQDSMWKAGILRLQFPGRYVAQTPPVQEPHTTELFGYVAWRSLSVKLNDAITDSFGTPDSRGTWYLDLSASQALGRRWILGSHLGRKQLRGTNPATGQANSRFSYTDYKVSVDYLLRPRLTLSLAETWTDANPALYTLNGYPVGGHHVAFTLKNDF